MLRSGEDLRRCTYARPGDGCRNGASRWFIRHVDKVVSSRCNSCPDPSYGNPEEVTRKEAEVYLVMCS